MPYFFACYDDKLLSELTLHMRNVILLEFVISIIDQIGNFDIQRDLQLLVALCNLKFSCKGAFLLYSIIKVSYHFDASRIVMAVP